MSFFSTLTESILFARHNLSDSELDQAATLTRSLLAHSDKTIAGETYRVFCNIVTSSLGPKQALSDTDPCPRLRFLVHSPVLVEVVCFGATSADNQVGGEEILELDLGNSFV